MTFLLRAGIETCTLCGVSVGQGWRAKTGHVCARPRFADREQAARQARIDATQHAYDIRGLGTLRGVETARMESAKTNRPTRERRTVLSTPSATNGKEAVDS